MKRALFITALCISLLISHACRLLDKDDLIPRKSRAEAGEWIGGRPLRQGKGPDEVIADTVVYVSAVEFPADYHWQRDTIGENRIFHISLYRNMKKILSVKGGPGTFISSDPDMHRILDGHIFTDYSTQGETVICRDGKELFRYPGREMICGFMAEEDGIYTLGTNRKGKGLSFRKDGAEIFSDEEGIPFGEMSCASSSTGGLYDIDGQVSFCYQIPGQALLMRKTRLFLVRSGVPEEVQLSQEISQIYDARVIDGTICLACAQTGSWRYPVLYAGQDVVTMPLKSGQRIANCRLRWSGDDIYLKTDYSYDTWNTTSSCMWNIKKDDFVPASGARVYDYYIDGRNIGYVYADANESRIMTRFMADDEHDYRFSTPGKFCFMSSSCAALCGTSFYAGLSSMTKGGHPLIVHNSMATDIPVNGFITSVSVSAGGKTEDPGS